MKKIITLLALAFCLNGNAQDRDGIMLINDFYNSKEFAKEPLVFRTGYNSEIDENIKWALDKFWTNSKTSTVDISNQKIDKTHSYIEIGEWHHKGQDGNFFVTEYHAINRTNDVKMIDKGLYMCFDNIKTSETGEIIGADKTPHLMACKAITYTMLFCNLVKNLSLPNGKELDGKASVSIMSKNKERLKTTTVLVPKELIDNGVSEEVFKNFSFKYKIESADAIAKRIKDGTDVKNYSHLLVYKKDNYFAHVYIVDIENGDLLYINTAGNKGYNIEDKLITKLMKNIDKPFGIR